ncbi:MAG TPA: hypothetical protein VFQ68_16320 [Streptosporangiaceae bacterium]|nr:hypothetical protein [Streptosporangiaceae bacterium]
MRSGAAAGPASPMQGLPALPGAAAQVRGAAAAAPAQRPPVAAIYNGTRWPTPEQNQAMMSQLAAFIGVSG